MDVRNFEHHHQLPNFGTFLWDPFEIQKDPGEKVSNLGFF